MSKILAVFGACGLQGGSVVRAVLADPVLSSEFTVRAITRDASKPAAKALADLGVQVVEADMSTPEQAAPAVHGAHTVFLVTNFWETRSPAAEISHGKSVADASRAANVQHIIFSSLIDVTATTRGRLTAVAHFDSKAEIERYLRACGVPTTFFCAGFYMTTLVQLAMRRVDGDGDDEHVLALPADPAKTQLPLFHVDDTGIFVKAAIRSFPHLVGKRILGAADYYTPERIAAEFAAVTGRPARVVRVPDEEFLTGWPDPSTAQQILEVYQLLGREGYFAGEGLGESLALLGEEGPTSWVEFVEGNKDKMMRGEQV